MTRTALIVIALAYLPAAPAMAQSRGAPCAAIAALLGDDSGQVTITRDTTVRDPRTREILPGCALRLDGVRSAWTGAASPDERVRAGLEALSWREHLHYAADGPDGTAFALWRGGATCFVRAEWDGGDDADPSYVARDDYVLTVECVALEPPGR